MDLLLANIEESMPIVLHPPPMTDDEYMAFCMHYEGFRIERMADGSITFMPPTGLDGSSKNEEIGFQLGRWTRQDGRGKAFESSVEFILPDGSALSPDASWVHKDRLRDVTDKRRFPRLCPDFVVELMSPSDRLGASKRKMLTWMSNGVQLGWLLDPDRKNAIVYRAGYEAEIKFAPERLEGEGPVAGFVLELSQIWADL